MKFLIFLLFAILSLPVNAQEKIPDKSELDSVMQNAVKQMNAQMAGMRVDEYMNLKFVTYDLNPPLFSYFYTSTALNVTKQETLNRVQIEAMNKFNITKTCSTKFMPLMKPYNLKVSHIIEDKVSGKIIYKITISHLDC